MRRLQTLLIPDFVRVLSRFSLVLAFGVGGALLACGDSGPGVLPSEPGTVSATLVSPNTLEGAVYVRFLGGGVEAIRAPEGELFLHDSESAFEAILVSEAGHPLSFELDLADLNTPPGVEIREVAGPDDTLRELDASYRFVFEEIMKP